MPEPNFRIIWLPDGIELASPQEADELGLEEAPQDIGPSVDEQEASHGVVSNLKK